MKKLNEAVERFCARNPYFGIPNLMLYIVGGNIAVYLLAMFSSFGAISFLSFNLDALLHGEIWRLVTFLFVPSSTSAFSVLITCYFYYWIGTTLEREWGTAKFSVYYISGVVLTLLGTVAVSLISGNFHQTLAGTAYINLALFFAFAMLHGEAQVLLFFIIPIRIKYIAYLDAALFAIEIISCLAGGYWVGAIVPVMALLNFFVFFYPSFERYGEYKKYQHKATKPDFRRQQEAARRAQEQQRAQGYRHKCCVCGRTDADSPDLQFRYCSKCAGYHCFCSDHIFSHVHFTE